MNAVNLKILDLVVDDKLFFTVDYDADTALDRFLTANEQNILVELTEEFSNLVGEYLGMWFMRFLEGEKQPPKEILDYYTRMMFGEVDDEYNR